MKRLVIEAGDHPSMVIARVDELRVTPKKLEVWRAGKAATMMHDDLCGNLDAVSAALRAVGDYVHVNVPGTETEE